MRTMFKFKISRKQDALALLSSALYDEQSFFFAFLADVRKANSLIIIESPFITHRRLNLLYPTLEKAVRRGIRVIINTRDPAFHDGSMQQQAINGIQALQNKGVEVLYTSNHHRKLAIIDDRILWEGSLNILSQTNSCEVMRRSESAELVKQMIEFTGLKRWYTK